MLVILFHTHGFFSRKSTELHLYSPESSLLYRCLRAFLENGDRGVSLFFVLSGFILCMPFASQYLKGGKTVSVKKYYLRRVTRLEPPYILAITLIFILQLATHTYSYMPLPEQWQHYFATLTYAHDFIYHRPPIVTVVAWSLEIEIQFYLIAPLLFRILLLAPTLRRFILLATSITFVLANHYFPLQFPSIYSHIQYFLMGILLSDLHLSYPVAEKLNTFIASLGALVLFLLITLWPGDGLAVTIALPFLVLGLYLVILKNDRVRKLFSWGMIPIIGGMCYSIYLLHYTLIAIFGKLFLAMHLPGGYLVNLTAMLMVQSILVISLSSIFYLYVERPFMDQKWTDKLLKKKRA